MAKEVKPENTQPDNQEVQANKDTTNKILMQKKSHAFRNRLNEIYQATEKRYQTLQAAGQENIIKAQGQPLWDEVLGTKDRMGTLGQALKNIAKNYDQYMSLFAEFVGILLQIYQAAVKSKSIQRTFFACTDLFVAEIKKQCEDILFEIKPKLEDFEVKGVTLTAGWRALAKEFEPLNSLEQWMDKVREWKNLERIKNVVFNEEQDIPEIEFDFTISDTGKVVWNAHIDNSPITDPQLQSILGGALDVFFIKSGCTIGPGNQLFMCDENGVTAKTPVPASSRLMRDLSDRVEEAKEAIEGSLSIRSSPNPRSGPGWGG